jgi:lysophospholipid acyltransferase (LPLAT)-like uncharacterized protein
LAAGICVNKFRGLILGFLIWIIYKIISSTWRVSVFEPQDMKDLLVQKTPLILSHFHGDELVLISLVKKYKIATMTSTSRDGEIMNTALKLLGAKTSRGSSTRGGVSALKGLIQLCKSGHSCSFAVDGPKGPIFEVKPGVFETSRLLKAPIFACGVTVDRAWHFPKSWNKTFLPKPFSKVQIYWQGPALWIDKSIDPRDSNLAKALQNQLFDARRHSANLIAAPSTGT